MQIYLNYCDRFVRTEEENRTISILLCKRNNKAPVEITLPKDGNIRARVPALPAEQERLATKALAMNESQRLASG